MAILPRGHPRPVPAEPPPQCMCPRDLVQGEHGADHRTEFAPVDQAAEGVELRPPGLRRGSGRSR